MVSDSVLIAVISTMGGILIAYIVNVVAKRRRNATPMESIFKGYDKLIAQQQDQIERLESLADRLQSELEHTREELVLTRERNNELKRQLEKLKQDYAAGNVVK